MPTDQNNPQDRRSFEALIVSKAWKDEEYRRRLVANPKEVVLEELQQIYPDAKIPTALNVQVMEEDANSIYLVVPAPPPASIVQNTSDEDLGTMAAGTGIAVVVTLAVAVNAAIAANVHTDANALAQANVNINANYNVNVNAG